MKILQLCHEASPVVGQGDLFEGIALAFPAPAWAFTYCTLTGHIDAEVAARTGARTIALGLSSKQVRARRPRTLARLVAFLREERFDLVITHRYKPWLLVSLAALFVPGLRVISVFHGYKQFDRRARRWLARLVLRREHRFVAISNAVKGDLVAHGIPERQIVVIPNGIDIDAIRSRLLDRANARTALGVPLDATFVGTIGRLRPIKGHRYLIDAFARTARRRPDLRLLIMGGGDQGAALRQQASALGLGDRVHITGALRDAYQYLTALDLFVMPSLSEGLGMAVIEAIIARRPVIGTHAGGIPEAMGPDGLTVPAADVEALAGAIETALAWTPAQRTAYVDTLSRHVAATFAVATYRERYRRLAEDMLGRREEAAGARPS
jgi:glycosyltransferase involved in cell wall biosynthesis